MSRISKGLLILSVICGLFLVPASAQDATTALKAKSIAKSKLAPAAKAKPKDSKTPAKGKAKKPKSLQQQADELQIRSDALMSLTEFLTDRRTKAQKRVEMMTAYLKSIGKLQEYQDSNTPPPTNKGEMTYRHAVNAVVKHVKKQGTTNYVDNPDKQEIGFLKRVCNANDRLAKKAWKEYTVLRDQTRSMGAYLDSIGKADDYKKWAGVEVDKQQQAFEKKMQAERDKEVAAYKKKRAKQQQERKQEAQKIAAEQRQDRQEKLQMRFKLRQQELYNQMREHTATPGWGGWGDPYNDVYCPRQYYP